MWHNSSNRGIPLDATLDEVEKMTKQVEIILMPVEKGKKVSPWMMISSKVYDILQKMMKPSEYTAHAGVCTWADGIYWIDVLSKEPSGMLVSNVGKTAKTRTRKITKLVDNEFVFPLIRGKNLKKWYVKSEGFILLPILSDGKIISEANLKTEYPNTYSYFLDFSEELRKRSGYKLFYKRSNKPFYSVLRTEYGCMPYKVVWKHISGKISGKALLECAVVDKLNEPVIPSHGVIMISCENDDEAHYVCGVLNSSLASLVAMAYSLEVHLTTDIPQKVSIPKFDPQNAIHNKISNLSRQSHELARKIHEENRVDLRSDLAKIEDEIDTKIADLYGVTDKELRKVKDMLMILK